MTALIVVARKHVRLPASDAGIPISYLAESEMSRGGWMAQMETQKDSAVAPGFS
jgi:hypothetical protein